jgi:hypothetical protein
MFQGIPLYALPVGLYPSCGCFLDSDFADNVSLAIFFVRLSKQTL